MPCLDQGLDAFVEHLLELEHVISELKLLGPVFILGNFNAHLGALGGQRGVGNTNNQGVLLYEMLGRCNLSVLSLGCIASGPPHTYHSGEVHTTLLITSVVTCVRPLYPVLVILMPWKT